MKREKRYLCKDCGKQYCSYGWVKFHVNKTGHNKFKEINRGNFLNGCA